MTNIAANAASVGSIRRVRQPTTSASTISFLQGLQNKMNASQGMVQLNASLTSASDVAQFANAGTIITLVGLPNYGAAVPSLTVTYDNGTITTNASEVSGLTYDGAAGTLRFTASHLSKYQANVPYIASTSNVTINDSTSQVIINAGTPAFTATIPSNATSAVLNTTAYLKSNATMTNVTINVSVIAISTSPLLSGTVNVTFPANVTIYGPAGWNGQIGLPIIELTSSANAGTGTATKAVVQLGFGEVQLNFSKAVRILLPGMAGKLAAYSRGGVVTLITTNCTRDSQSDGDGLAPAGDCKIDVGSDLVIWTKHFTLFFAYVGGSTISSSSGLYYTTTASVTPTPAATAVASGTPTAVPTVSGTPIETPAPGQATVTAQPSVTASVTPTGTSTGTTAGNDMLWIIVGVVILAAAAAYVLMQKK